MQHNYPVLSFLSFALVGVFATLLHVSVFTAIVELLLVPPVAASIPAFLVAMLSSYAANSRWTFKRREPHSVHLLKYALVAGLSLCLNIAITYITVDVLGYWYVIALAFVISVVPVVTFLLNCYWTYR
jgi:putative flippase GtrA